MPPCIGVRHCDSQHPTGEVGVLAGEVFRARALALRDGLDDGAVLIARDQEVRAGVGHHRSWKHHGARRRERQRAGLGDAALQHRALGEVDQGGVERLVEIHVDLERVDRQGPERFHLRAGAPHGAQFTVVAQALDGKARRRPFEHAAQLDGVKRFGEAEPADREAAGRQHVEQAHVGEPFEREADRRPRRAEAGDERELRDAFAAGELAVQQHFAQADEGAPDLGVVVRHSRILPHARGEGQRVSPSARVRRHAAQHSTIAAASAANTMSVSPSARSARTPGRAPAINVQTRPSSASRHHTSRQNARTSSRRKYAARTAAARVASGSSALPARI